MTSLVAVCIVLLLAVIKIIMIAASCHAATMRVSKSAYFVSSVTLIGHRWYDSSIRWIFKYDNLTCILHAFAHAHK